MKFSNRILLNVGLCVTFYDFISIGDPYLYPGEGSAMQIVKFRMVVFRPFIGEIMTGKLVGSSKEGLKISVEFFEGILIPAALLQAPCVFNPVDGLWTWKYDDNDFVMDIGQEVPVLQYIFSYQTDVGHCISPDPDVELCIIFPCLLRKRYGSKCAR